MTLEQIPHFDLNSQPLLAAGAQVEIPPEENFVQNKDCLHQSHRYASLIFCPFSPVKHVYLLLFLIAVRDIPSKHNSPSSLLLPNAFQCLPNACPSPLFTTCRTLILRHRRRHRCKRDGCRCTEGCCCLLNDKHEDHYYMFWLLPPPLLPPWLKRPPPPPPRRPPRRPPPPPPPPPPFPHGISQTSLFFFTRLCRGT